MQTIDAKYFAHEHDKQYNAQMTNENEELL